MQTRTHAILIIAVLISTIGLPVVNIPSATGVKGNFKIKSEAFPSHYNESSPITIDGNMDFANQADANSWQGNGTQENPYIIAGFNITSESSSVELLSISNTDVYFRVESNLLVGGSIAIYLNNVTYSTLINNTIHDSNTNGILAIVANHIQIANNTIYNAIDFGDGLYWNQVINSTITNNTINDCDGKGLLLDYCTDCTLSYNTIQGNDGDGIGLRDSSKHEIHKNDIYNNHMNGIFLGKAPHCNITENIIHGNEGAGIEQQISDNCLIESNIIYYNQGSGMRASGDFSMIKNNTFYYNPKWALRVFTDNITILYNNFIDNGFSPGKLQAMDEGVGNSFDHNYWSDWTYQDRDNNSIVDSPYRIGGDKDSFDSNPHILPYLEYRLHVLSTPVIIFPNNTLFYDVINITWGRAGDTFGHNITYSLYYSTDGFTWNEITSGLEHTSFLWNVTLLPSNINYSLKVVSVCSAGLTTSRFTEQTFEIREHNLTIPLILYPNGGELLNESCPISWHSTYDSLGHSVSYSIYYSADNGSTWHLVVEDIYYCDYEWNTGALTPGSNYLIKVRATCSEGLTVEDVSDSTFTLNPHTLQVPILISPKSGEVVRNYTEIRWESAIDSWQHNVQYNLFISSNGGETWNMLEESWPYNYYSWDTTLFPDGTMYKVKIIAICEGGLEVEYISDYVFTVDNVDGIDGVLIPMVAITCIFAVIVVVFCFIQRKRKIG